MAKGDNKKRKNKKSINKNVNTSNKNEDVAVAKNRRAKKNLVLKKEIFYAKENYIIIGVGLVIVIIGLALMSGGYNTPDTWDVNEIYSFRRITLAPIVILSGLAIVIFAIFKSSGNTISENTQGE
ncbi:DUF3098 domain-containing protein [Aureispira]|nr:DUF3098 domain-containing protein [Aureispira sp.]